MDMRRRRRRRRRKLCERAHSMTNPVIKFTLGKL